MTNTTVLLISFLAAAAQSFDIETFDFPDQIKGHLIQLSNKCIDITGAERKVLRQCSETGQIPDEPKIKCYLKCLHDNFNVDLEKEVAAITHDDSHQHDINEHVHAMVTHVQERCGDMKSDDKCEEAWLKANCQLKLYKGEIAFCFAAPFFGH
uniref:CSON008186 protein n=1 Tax=Culicoides sonorensis TaxID=179676 RepID=A0A336MWF6_CULSO